MLGFQKSSDIQFRSPRPINKACLLVCHPRQPAPRLQSSSRPQKDWCWLIYRLLAPAARSLCADTWGIWSWPSVYHCVSTNCSNSETHLVSWPCGWCHCAQTELTYTPCNQATVVWCLAPTPWAQAAVGLFEKDLSEGSKSQ
jgi:hypothetical protein